MSSGEISDAVPDDKVWERQAGETSRAFHAFQAYLRIGPERTIGKAYEMLRGKAAGTGAIQGWKRWSARYGWVRRAAAWDDANAAALANIQQSKIAQHELELLESRRRAELEVHETLLEAFRAAAAKSAHLHTLSNHQEGSRTGRQADGVKVVARTRAVPPAQLATFLHAMVETAGAVVNGVRNPSRCSKAFNPEKTEDAQTLVLHMEAWPEDQSGDA